jgi:hypothetical protein
MKVDLSKKTAMYEATKSMVSRQMLVHNIATPVGLVDDMIGRATGSLTAKAKILVLLNPEFVISLKEDFPFTRGNITLFTNGDGQLERIAQKMNISITDTLDIDMKFDLILANPPYKGVSALHQKFFNKAVELLVDGGQMVFIQPATPYINNKDNKKSSEAEMLGNVEQHTSSVVLMDGCKVFPDVEVGSNLAITHLTKDHSCSGSVDFLEYSDGSCHENIEIKAIVRTEMQPSIFLSLKNKIAEYVSEYGSIQDIIVDPTNNGQDDHEGTRFYIQGIRGHIGSPDFFTFCSTNNSFDRVESGRGIPADNDKQLRNIRTYLECAVARFCLSILKYNVQMSRGELSMVPVVNFNYKWDDESLCELFKITKKEYKEILRVIPEYH